MKISLIDTRSFNELIIKKGYSKNELSRVAQVSQPTIVQISNGTRNPSPGTAKRISDVLGVEFDDVFTIET
ncbi:transcriptional regulator [Campylobacter sp. 1]|nr:transcriptional regulator [Campylobacter sp. 1]